MNETLSLALAWRPALCWERSSSAACGGPFAGAFRSQRPALWFLRQHAAAHEHRPGWDFILSGARIGNGWLLCLLGFVTGASRRACG